MQVKRESLTPTSVGLTVVADQALLDTAKQQVLSRLARTTKLAGFRQGKAPLRLVEKSVDQSLLQSEFLDTAINTLYGQALDQERLRPVAQPEVNITKFVPFTTLEFSAEVEIVGAVKLPDYKKIKVEKKPVKVTEKDVDAVVADLQSRVADKKVVTRAAKEGDEVVIDFAGTDAKSQEPVSGADGKAYPLTLGSNAFIPGFEANLVGMKAGEQKTFDITFPKDYGVAALQNRKVSFAVTVHTVNGITLPKVDAAFAAKVGPFKSVTELRTDIKKQVQSERESQAERDFQNELLEKITDKTTAAIPDTLIENEIDRMEQEERQNLMYRGQTWQEHLDAEGVTEEEHRNRQKELAATRVKSGLMLAEAAEKEGVKVTDEEIDVRLKLMRAQYPDKQMQAEFDKPETRREIMSRLVSEKTIAILSDYARK